jgi:hypothetical protein
MHFKYLPPLLLLLLMLFNPAAQAAGEIPSSAPAPTGQAHCTPASSDACLQVAAADNQRTVSSRHENPETCAKDDQDCDTRGKSQRDRAAAEMRDRHACRD